MGVPVPRTPAGGCPRGPFSHFGPRPLTAANTGARGARAPHKSGRASRRLREYLARFLGVSGADFNAAPLGKPPLRPPRRGAKNRRLYIGISHFPPSPIFHLHLFPGMRTPFPHISPIFRKNILPHFYASWGRFREFTFMAGSRKRHSGRLVCQNFKSFLQKFPFVPEPWNSSKIIARDPFCSDGYLF